MKAKRVTFDGVELVILRLDEPSRSGQYAVRVVREFGKNKGFNFKRKTYLLGGGKNGN